MDLTYHEAWRMGPEETRRKLVETYLRTGSISQAARLWSASRAAVRK